MPVSRNEGEVALVSAIPLAICHIESQDFKAGLAEAIKQPVTRGLT